MTMMLARLSRAFEFARHMPMRKLTRRMELDVRRRIGDRLGRQPVRLSSQAKRALAPPQPIFAPRPSGVHDDGDRLSFTFLNRKVAMPALSIDWSAPSRAPVDQLWRMNLHYMEYLEGADTALWRRLVAAWVSDNPQTGRGVWRDSWNSYALSLRVVVLMQELQRRGADLPQSLVDRVEASVVEQLQFLEGAIETDLGGNHLIKNIKALIWGSAFFDGADAERGGRRRCGCSTGSSSFKFCPTACTTSAPRLIMRRCSRISPSAATRSGGFPCRVASTTCCTAWRR